MANKISVFPFNEIKENSSLNAGNIREYLPKYLLFPVSVKFGPFKEWCLTIVQKFLILLVKIFLSPRKGNVGKLDIKEVEEVYNREAKSYDLKHHLTTRGMDTMWRRRAGWFVINIAKYKGNPIDILDLCTGTGLTVEEMITILGEWSKSAHIVGLDYNEKMLSVARSRDVNHSSIKNGVIVDFVKGNAMELVGKSTDGCKTFSAESFDAVTQVFGDGGINNSLAVFQGVIKLLKPGGEYLMIDMHRPIANLPGEMPFLWKWFKFPLFEHTSYSKHTMPVVLSRLWGWKDPTIDFYTLPLVTLVDNGICWGFEVKSFSVETERWWFGLPLMPTARIVVKKVEITFAEFVRRNGMLNDDLFKKI